MVSKGIGEGFEGVYEGVAYRLRWVFRRSLEVLEKGLCVEGVYEGVAYRLGGMSLVCL